MGSGVVVALRRPAMGRREVAGDDGYLYAPQQSVNSYFAVHNKGDADYVVAGRVALDGSAGVNHSLKVGA